MNDTDYALDSHQCNELLVEAGNVFNIGEYAEQLRLKSDQEECSAVLDYMADQKMVGISVDYVEQVVWDLFGNRFIEP